MSLELLRKIPLFSELSEDQLHKVLDLCERRRYEAGTKVIVEGQEGDEMFIVRQGEVEVSKAITVKIPGQDQVSFEKRLVVLGEGNYFGEVALLVSDTRSATVTARSKTAITADPGAQSTTEAVMVIVCVPSLTPSSTIVRPKVADVSP